MNCKICSKLLQEYLEDSLSEDLINELNAHLKECRRCAVFFRTYSLTVSLSQRIETPCCVSSEKIKELTLLLHERLFPK